MTQFREGGCELVRSLRHGLSQRFQRLALALFKPLGCDLDCRQRVGMLDRRLAIRHCTGRHRIDRAADAVCGRETFPKRVGDREGRQHR